MNITPQINLPISAGSNPNQQRAAAPDLQRSTQLTSPSQTSLILQSQFNATGNIADSQKIQPTINAQPVSDQNLTHQGSQAKNMYQEVELSNEAELMPRLSVIA